VAKSSTAGRVNLLGYCMGGILSSIYTAVHPEHVASLVTLAAPVRFDGSGLLGAWTRSPTYDVRALVGAYGNVPWQLMQSAFHMLRPTMTLAKIVHVLDREWDDESLDGFVALETWGNDNVALPGEAYRRYIEELYQQDKLARGEFTLSGEPARLENIACPSPSRSSTTTSCRGRARRSSSISCRRRTRTGCTCRADTSAPSSRRAHPSVCGPGWPIFGPRVTAARPRRAAKRRRRPRRPQVTGGGRARAVHEDAQPMRR
jgi:hypothetical protein